MKRRGRPSTRFADTQSPPRATLGKR